MTVRFKDTPAIRQAVIDACLTMNASGLNQGTSGNVSLRAGDRMLITPSATPYDAMTPEMIVSMSLEDGAPLPDGPAPSTEWHFHQRLLRERPDINAVIHAHPTHCTALSINRMMIPACHYMVAVFGGHDVRLAPYALYGSEALSKGVVAAMEGRSACLMSNHGATVVGDTLEKAIWRMGELEALAQQYILAQSIGTPHILSEAEIDEVLASIKNYGLKSPR